MPSRAIVHVRFEELERDPLGQVERIFRSIQLGEYAAAPPASRPTCIRSTTTASSPTPSRRRASDGSPNAGSHS
jgi:hypothetical protein